MDTVSLRHFDVSLTPRHQSEFGALKVRFVWGRGARGLYNYKKLQKKVVYSFLEDTLHVTMQPKLIPKTTDYAT